MRDDRVMRVLARDNDEVDDGWLCDKGRFAYQSTHTDERITQPLVREGDRLAPASWEKALDAAASALKKAGPRAAALAGGDTTNEEAFLLARLFREGLGSGALQGSPAPRAAGRAVARARRPGAAGDRARPRVRARRAGARLRPRRRRADPRPADPQGRAPPRRPARGRERAARRARPERRDRAALRARRRRGAAGRPRRRARRRPGQPRRRGDRGGLERGHGPRRSPSSSPAPARTS